MKKQVNNVWRILAIIFIVLFAMLLIYNIYSVSVYNKSIKNQNICYYDICNNYTDAYYESTTQVCSCLNYDLLGNEQVVYTQYMGRK